MTTSESRQLTHSVGVAAMIVKSYQVLVLRRTRPPFVWAPPGGRLLPNEDPILGLKREVYEECGIEVTPIRTIATWFGQHDEQQLLALCVACQFQNGEIRLSDEHEDFNWINPKNLIGQPFTIGKVPIFGSITDYLFAVSVVDLAMTEWHTEGLKRSI